MNELEKILGCKLYTLKQVANILRITTRTLNEIIKTGGIKTYHIHRRRLISDKQLEEYLKKCQNSN